MESETRKKGIVYTAASYIMWGVFPLYWKMIDTVASDEIIAHRILWSFVFMMILVVFANRFNQFRAEWKRVLHRPRIFFGLVAASLLISTNWYIYIWAVNHDRIIEASLGYYINPLISILLGMLVLKERLSLWQIFAVILAAIGVGVLTIEYGSFPWISISLACTFGLYGLVKKLTNFDSLIGLTLETLVITPLAILYILYLLFTGHVAFGTNLTTSILLIGGGIATAVPLLYFAKGAKLIPLSMVGFLQYISPTISLFLGVFLYHEHFTKAHMTAFLFIWIALVVFSLAKTRLMVKLESKLSKNEAVKAS
ncbi:EamA family transporter RarD [Ectobacillus polymachus]|uniref:EamA family transporter RarD n=1 Tax=Ectobacillus polymachus TaxID=1508806 RepID=UPI003A85701A